MAAPDFSDIFAEDRLDTSKLHPDLKPFLSTNDAPFPVVLKHPLVFSVPFFSYIAANRMYEEKTKKLAEFLDAKQFDSAIWLYERPYRIDILYDWYFTEKRIDLDALRQMLPGIWSDTEFPEQFGLKPRRLFMEAGYCSDTDKKLTGTLTVYRGDASKTTGIEWSLSKKTATWFAKRFGCKTPVLATGQADAKDVLAYITNRKEEEVIILPENVQNVKYTKLTPGNS